MSMNPQPPARQPAFNAPPVIIGLIGFLVLCYGLQQLVSRTDLVFWLAFVPSRYGLDLNGMEQVFPGEPFTDVTTLLTYAFLHGSIIHLVMNSVMLLAAGAPVARLMSGAKFLLFALVCSVAGACTFYFFHQGEFLPVIGASAAVSGMLGAVGRVMFAPVQALLHKGEVIAARRVGLAPLDHPRLIMFAIVWTGINLMGAIGAPGAGGIAIAWEAHIGGFFAGLFLVGFFAPEQPTPPQNQA